MSWIEVDVKEKHAHSQLRRERLDAAVGCWGLPLSLKRFHEPSRAPRPLARPSAPSPSPATSHLLRRHRAAEGRRNLRAHLYRRLLARPAPPPPP
ncbi:Hypothetical protein NTJ_10784 [Nesidiocoris tenuis]|uniref:Uncharacterized protein n=1 Tax=Nesidiocoris tenuis TaxID=355587 RepID=A0ABN7B2C4_9HEMI|nr:Hypothetical protein NTJ_10784 [Nesidiocoris tenuis]